MLAYCVYRLLQSLFVMILVSFISFILLVFLGNPVDQILGVDASAADRIALADELGLNDPVFIQYIRYMLDILSGDFGYSYRMKEPVFTLIIERLPATLELVFLAAAFAIILGTLLGAYSAIVPDRIFIRIILMFSNLAISVPSFIIGVGLIYVFSIYFRILPSSGRGGVVDLGIWQTSFFTLDGWRHLILPALTLSLFQIAIIMRLVRAEMVNILNADFIKFAYARGLPFWSIYISHGLRNALTPLVTIMGVNFGGLVAFSVITEFVFQWPGLGLMFIQAIYFVDMPIVSTYLICVGLLFVAINLCVDILYMRLDPRLILSGRGNHTNVEAKY